MNRQKVKMPEIQHFKVHNYILCCAIRNSFTYLPKAQKKWRVPESVEPKRFRGQDESFANQGSGMRVIRMDSKG